MEKNNSLLYAILGGVVTCFVCVGMVFLFPSKGNNGLKGNNTSSNFNQSGYVNTNDDEEILLGDTCTTCSSGTLTNGQCVTKSGPTGQNHDACTGNNQNWENEGCYNVTYTSPTCSSCNAGKYLTGGHCATCPSGKYCTGGTAQPADCSEGYSVNSSQTGCDRTSCPAGQYLDSSHSTGCADCPSGKYCSGGTAMPQTCSEGYSVNSSQTGCVRTSCPAGQYLDSSHSTGCADCPSGKYCSGGTAMPQTCSEGYGVNSSQTGCVRTSCPAGQGLDSSASTGCSNCAAGTYSPANDGTCHPCAEGYTSAAGATSCTISSCPAGQGADSSATTGCSACTTGYVSPAGSTTCTECTGGKVPNADRSACVDNLCSSISDAGTCSARSDCEWDYTNYCHDKPKSCASISEAGECSARDDCEWDYTYYCHDKEIALESLSGGGTAYVTPDTSKTFVFTAKSNTGKGFTGITWKVTGSKSAIASDSCTGTTGSVCSVAVKGWGCDYSGTVTVTATYNGVSKTAKITVKSYRTWTDEEWNKEVKSGEKPYIYNDTSLDNNVCYGYSDYDSKTGTYKKRWTRCCGGTSQTPDPEIPESYSYCCIKNDNTDAKWYSGESSKTCPSGYTIDEEKTLSTCYTPYSVPYCYIDDLGEYEWTATPKDSWKKVEGVTKEEDCKEEENPACYLDPNEKYIWGKYAKTDGYTLITSIKDEANCTETPQEEAACYKKDDDYVWTTTAPAGYTKVESIKTPAECAGTEDPACYVHGNDFVWGKFEKVTGYIKLWDITKEEECKLPDSDACYIDTKGNYVWGKYGNDSSYTLVPAVTEQSACNNNVPVPSTASNVSKLVYVFMAILMACGIGFIYYSSVIKKNN